MPQIRYAVMYVDNYGEHNIEVMTEREHDEATAEQIARHYLCRKLKHIRVRRAPDLPNGIREMDLYK